MATRVILLKNYDAFVIKNLVIKIETKHKHIEFDKHMGYYNWF